MICKKCAELRCVRMGIEPDKHGKHCEPDTDGKTIKCAICGEQVSLLGFGSHVSRKHQISTKQYYDAHIKGPEEGTCAECGKPTRYVGLSAGYRTYCSMKCMANSEAVKKKKESTCLKKYGTPTPWESEEVREKIRKTNMERYGVDNPWKTPEAQRKARKTQDELYGGTGMGSSVISAKIKKTNVERYGCENPFGNEDIKDKIKQTNLERYGTERYTQTEESKERFKAISLERYGVENLSQNEEIQERRKRTFTERYGGIGSASPTIRRKQTVTNQELYGVDFPFESEEIQQKAEDTCLKRYGVRKPATLGAISEKIRASWKRKTPSEKQEIVNKRKQTKKGLYGDENYCNHEQCKRTNLERYGVEYTNQVESIRQKMLATLFANGNTSNSEIRFAEYLTANHIEFIREYVDDRYPYHCDFYLPERDMFIELNIFWSHGKKWFNAYDDADIVKLEFWKEKSSESKAYSSAVDVWSRRDIEKRKRARENKLNYVVLWSESDIIEWFSLGMPNGKDWDKEYTWRKR